MLNTCRRAGGIDEEEDEGPAEEEDVGPIDDPFDICREENPDELEDEESSVPGDLPDKTLCKRA